MAPQEAESAPAGGEDSGARRVAGELRSAAGGPERRLQPRASRHAGRCWAGAAGQGGPAGLQSAGRTVHHAPGRPAAHTTGTDTDQSNHEPIQRSNAV